MSSSEPTVLFDQFVTLLPYYKFAQSFASSRFPFTEFQVKSSQKIRWTLGFERRFSLPFFKINFHFRNISVADSMKIVLSANATVSPHRRCRQTFRNSKRLWRGGTKVELEFECNATSAQDYDQDIKLVSDQIILETKCSKDITYKLIAIMLGQSYETGGEHLCGEPEMRFGQVIRTLRRNSNYSIECLEEMNYVSPDNPDLPGK